MTPPLWACVEREVDMRRPGRKVVVTRWVETNFGITLDAARRYCEEPKPGGWAALGSDVGIRPDGVAEITTKYEFRK